RKYGWANVMLKSGFGLWTLDFGLLLARFIRRVSLVRREVRATRFRAAHISQISRGRSFPEICRVIPFVPAKSNPFRRVRAKILRSCVPAHEIGIVLRDKCESCPKPKCKILS